MKPKAGSHALPGEMGRKGNKGGVPPRSCAYFITRKISISTRFSLSAEWGLGRWGGYPSAGIGEFTTKTFHIFFGEEGTPGGRAQ